MAQRIFCNRAVVDASNSTNQVVTDQVLPTDDGRQSDTIDSASQSNSSGTDTLEISYGGGQANDSQSNDIDGRELSHATNEVLANEQSNSVVTESHDVNSSQNNDNDDVSESNDNKISLNITSNYFIFINILVPSSVHSYAVKLENSNQRLQKLLATMNRRIGDEIISDEDDSEGSDDMDRTYITVANTRHFQLDSSFGKFFYFITNVSTKFTLMLSYESHYSRFLHFSINFIFFPAIFYSLKVIASILTV